MDKPEKDGKDQPSSKRFPKLNKRKLDRFLSSLCEAAGMTGAPKKKAKDAPGHELVCQGPCANADWRAHLDVPAGILCVSAAWSANKQAEKHRDVTITLTYRDEHGKRQHHEMVFCDSEVRWLMETIWHAPIWD